MKSGDIKRKKSDFKDDAIEDYVFNSCSVYDCTGLIPSAITDENEAESYEEIYPYISPTIKKNASASHAFREDSLK